MSARSASLPAAANTLGGTAGTIGVLALQGGVAEHLRLVESLGARGVAVRRAEQLLGPDGPRVDALILPGGESSAIDRIARRLELFEPLRTLVQQVPVLGTCAGLIMLASNIEDPAPGQHTLGALDAVVRRNALGSQVASHEAEFEVDVAEIEGPVRGALIRAPEVVALGAGARAIVHRDGRVLGVTSQDQYPRLGRVTGISFHPELSGDPAFHRALLAQV